MNIEGNWLKSFLPNWNEVNLTENSAEKVYEIALINPENIFVASTAVNVKNIDKFKEKSLLKLIVIENKESHKFSAAIMEFAAFEANNLSLSQLRYKNYRTFSGAVNFYKINGQLANGWIYKEGKLMAKTESALNLALTNINAGVVGKGKLMLADAGSLACGTRSVAHWRKLCITIGEVDGWGYSGSGTTTSCRWEVYHTTEAIYCQALESVEDAFGGFEGGGSIGEGYVDCAGVPNGTAYQTDCGCIGGTTGKKGCASRDIIDSLLNKCMKDVKDILITQNSQVNALLRSFTGNNRFSPNYTWILKNNTLPSTDLAATGSWDRTKRNVTTEIDDAKFSNASDLAIAKTLLHEGIHAYLVAYFANDPFNANKEYSVLFDEYIKTKNPDLNALHHNEMARKFVEQISFSLRDYGNSLNYVFSSNYEKERFYSDLAWGGLFETNVFKTLSIDKQNRIKNVILIEQKGEDLSGTKRTQKGKTGGCKL